MVLVGEIGTYDKSDVAAMFQVKSSRLRVLMMMMRRAMEMRQASRPARNIQHKPTFLRVGISRVRRHGRGSRRM